MALINKELYSKPWFPNHKQVTFKRVTHASEPEQWPTYYQLEYTFQWLLRGIKHKLWANSSLKCYVHYHSKSWRKLSTDQGMKDKDHSSNRLLDPKFGSHTQFPRIWLNPLVSVCFVFPKGPCSTCHIVNYTTECVPCLLGVYLPILLKRTKAKISGLSN